jgi:hypothetical protein
MIRRRLFLGALSGLVVVPPIVRAASIMPIAVERPPAPFLPPIGSIYPIGGAIPAGWLPCDGREVSAFLFPDLARVLRAVSPDIVLPDLATVAVRSRAPTPFDYAIRAR